MWRLYRLGFVQECLDGCFFFFVCWWASKSLMERDYVSGARSAWFDERLSVRLFRSRVSHRSAIIFVVEMRCILGFSGGGNDD